ncbi:VCBS repeat-containing protein, partial [bacterium]|nr:VCBS repeat-containing protein [bacterium]MBU1637765.1 VCBS repeat-containing protein [bacterium]
MIQITGVNNPRNVHAADMNGDGVKDIIGTAYGTADIYWWEYVAATNSFTPHLVADLFTGSYAVYGADLDGDEDMDIIATSANSPGAIRWWENLDDGTSFIEHSITEAFSGASSVQVMDIDGDEDLDVLASAYDADDIAWWENDGSQNFSAHTITGSFDGARGAFAIDLDDDGDMDVLGAAEYADDIAWWENDGS